MGRILTLEERCDDFDKSSLSENEDFASAVIDTQMAVLRSNAFEKREVLANAVINVALGRGPEEDRRQMFMTYIADLTPWHLRLLALLNDPTGIAGKKGVDMSNVSMGALSHLVERVYPELADQRDFVSNWHAISQAVGFQATSSST